MLRSGTTPLSRCWLRPALLLSPSKPVAGHSVTEFFSKMSCAGEIKTLRSASWALVRTVSLCPASRASTGLRRDSDTSGFSLPADGSSSSLLCQFISIARAHTHNASPHFLGKQQTNKHAIPQPSGSVGLSLQQRLTSAPLSCTQTFRNTRTQRAELSVNPNSLT